MNVVNTIVLHSPLSPKRIEHNLSWIFGRNLNDNILVVGETTNRMNVGETKRKVSCSHGMIKSSCAFTARSPVLVRNIRCTVTLDFVVNGTLIVVCLITHFRSAGDQ